MTMALNPPALQRIISLEQAAAARQAIESWPAYQQTPLHRLDAMASALGVRAIYYKDESHRFGLKSFKALGGAYAVARQLQETLHGQFGHCPSHAQLFARQYAEQAGELTVSCATDGNHGRSVAWGAQLFGCQSVIYLHRDVSIAREQAIRAFGADVVRIDGNYDDSVRRAASDADRFGRVIISDTSYDGYRRIPIDVMHGYTVMFAEIVSQLNETKPTHVFCARRGRWPGCRTLWVFLAIVGKIQTANHCR